MKHDVVMASTILGVSALMLIQWAILFNAPKSFDSATSAQTIESTYPVVSLTPTPSGVVVLP